MQLACLFGAANNRRHRWQFLDDDAATASVKVMFTRSAAILRLNG